MISRLAVGYLIALLCNGRCGAQSSAAPAGSTGTTTSKSSALLAEETFHNIQVLKGIPAAEVPPVMHLIRASLGVRCEYCHETEDGKYQLDVKKEKRRAREMMIMTRQLNQASFGGANVVTCNTCHHGSAIPAAMPQIESAFANVIRQDPDEPVTSPLPSTASLFAHYEAATHVRGLPAMRLTLEASHAKLMDLGTSRARAIARATTDTGEVLIDRERAFIRSPLPDGRFVLVGSDGHRAWTLGPDGLQWIPNGDFVRFQRRLNPLFPLRVGSADFAEGRVSGRETIGGREAYVVAATGVDGTAQTLWFATDDGLLLRRTYFHPIAIGQELEQFDFSAYRRYGEFELPSDINTSYLDDQHLGVRKKITDIKLDVPVFDRDFAPPDR